MEDIKLRSLRDRQRENLKREEGSPVADIKDAAPVEAIVPAKKRRVVVRAAKSLAFVVFVFVIGGLGGVWLDRVLLPTLLVKYPSLNQYEYLKLMGERTTIIHETEEVNISQEEGAASAIEKVRPSITEIMAKDANGQYASIGTGIILTSDGYILTPLKNVLLTGAVDPELQVRLRNGSSYAATLVSQDNDYSLAILKIPANNLSVIPYIDTDDLRLGDRLIIVDDAINTDIISKILEQYIMPGATDSSYQKRIQIVQDLGTNASGAAVINIEGRLVGVGQEANIVIPISEIRGYINQSVAQK